MVNVDNRNPDIGVADERGDEKKSASETIEKRESALRHVALLLHILYQRLYFRARSRVSLSRWRTFWERSPSPFVVQRDLRAPPCLECSCLRCMQSSAHW